MGQRTLGEVRVGSGTLGEVRDGSVDHPGRPGWVGGHSRWSGTSQSLSWRSTTCRGSLGDVRTGRGTLLEVQNGLTDRRGGLG